MNVLACTNNLVLHSKTVAQRSLRRCSTLATARRHSISHPAPHLFHPVLQSHLAIVPLATAFSTLGPPPFPAASRPRHSALLIVPSCRHCPKPSSAHFYCRQASTHCQSGRMLGFWVQGDCHQVRRGVVHTSAAAALGAPEGSQRLSQKPGTTEVAADIRQSGGEGRCCDS